LYQIIDIETENTGTDIMEDNKRILSIQIGDDTKQNLYWADSGDPQWTLESAKREIESMLSQGVIFAGYNIKGFDVRFLKQFLDVEIPESNILDLCLCQSQKLTQLTGKTKVRLEEACEACGVKVTHKQRMNEKAKKYKSIEAFKKQALAKAEELVKSRDWSVDFAYRYALDKVAGGNAIYDSYLEFVESSGQKNTLFYEYAVGDVVSEYQLLKALGY
jgi:metal-sulfur cluster biosynthetic enzyme